MFGQQVKEKLQQIVLKLLVVVQSKKFWACLLGSIAALSNPELDAPAKIAAVVALVIAYAGLSVADDYLTRKLQ